MSYTNGKQRRQRTTHTRFQTGLGMRLIRRELDIFNSLRRRGEVDLSVTRENFVICGCGAEGCGFVSCVYRNRPDQQQRLAEGKDPWRMERRASA